MKTTAILLAGAVTVSASAAHAQEAPGNTLTADFIFEEVVKLSPAVEVGETPRGKRRFIPITGGRFEGPGIKGEIIPGGWDWQLDLGNGCTEIEADYFLKTDDGVIINVLNKGTLCMPKPGGAAPEPVRTTPVFEAPVGKYEWLNGGAYTGTLGMAPQSEGPAVLIRFYKIK